MGGWVCAISVSDSGDPKPLTALKYCTIRRYTFAIPACNDEEEEELNQGMS